MLKNFDVPFLDFDGNAVKENDKEILLGSLIFNAIQQSKDNSDISGEEKYGRFKLIEKIVKGGDIELTIEELATIKKCIGSGIYTPLVVGRVYDLLEA